jgi:hypothetical protein
MRKGDKLICINEIKNIMNMPLFEKGKTYDVLYVDNEDVEVMVCLNHNLYANEYNSFPLEWVNKNFENGGR